MKILHQSQPNSRQVLWRIQNNGSDSWPNGCYLISSNQLQRIEMPSIRPGESCEVVASICPTDAIVWRLCAPHGEYFGDHLCLTTLNSFNTPSDELNQRLAQMAVSDRDQISPAVHNYPQINIVISEQMEWILLILNSSYVLSTLWTRRLLCDLIVVTWNCINLWLFYPPPPIILSVGPVNGLTLSKTKTYSEIGSNWII